MPPTENEVFSDQPESESAVNPSTFIEIMIVIMRAFIHCNVQNHESCFSFFLSQSLELEP